MLTLLLKAFTWTTGVLPQVLSFLGKFSDNSSAELASKTAASVAIEASATTADVAVNSLKAQQLSEDRSWWVTAWEKPLLFYVCLLHFGAIMIDSTFRLHWGVPAPPPPYDTWEGIVILSDVLVLSTGALTNKIVGAIWK